jgi:hypothetical protein
MKLLLRDYIASLRERSELDRVLVPLLIASDLRVVREPELGMPEHGLDIGAVGPFPRRKTLVLMQVKQGDVTRRNWDSGLNAVRQSLNDLIDHADAFQSLTGEARPLPVVIVLAHSGHIRSNVRAAYDGYVRRARQTSKIEVVHWDLEKLTDLFADRLLREELFPHQSIGLLRRLLSYLEVPGYDLRHLLRLFDVLLPDGASSPPAKEIVRPLLQAATVLLMVENVARNDANDLSVAVRAYELGFLRIFCWSRKRGLLLDKGVQALVVRLLDSYIRVALEFLWRLAPLVEYDDGLARSGTAEVIEYPLRCLFVGGLAAQLFLILVPRQQHPPIAEALRFLAHFLLRFRKTATGATRPVFDHQLTEIALISTAFRAMGRLDEARTYVGSVVEALALDKVRGLPLPEGTGSLDAVGQALLGAGKPADYIDTSSCLLTALAELCAILEVPEGYSEIRTRWASGVNLQQWYPTDAYIDVGSERPPVLGEIGSSEVGITLPEEMVAFRAEIARRAHLDAPIRSGQTTVPFFEAAAYIASRVLALRLPPFYWRRLSGSAVHPDAKVPTDSAPANDAAAVGERPATDVAGDAKRAAAQSMADTPGRRRRAKRKTPKSRRRES